MPKRNRKFQVPFNTIELLFFISLSMLVVGIIKNDAGLTPLFRWGSLVFFLTTIFLWFFGRKSSYLQNFFRSLQKSEGKSLQAIKPSLQGWLTLFIVACGLYAELMLIRWHSSAFQIFGFFKNVTLLACFLGLGAGYALKSSRPLYLAYVIPGLSFSFKAKG